MSVTPHSTSANAAPRYRRLAPFTFHREVAGTGGASLLFLVSAHCGACRKWKQLLQSYVIEHPLTVFEVDAGDDAALAGEFSIFHLPALFLFKDGQYHCRLDVEARADYVRRAIAQALAQTAEEPP